MLLRARTCALAVLAATSGGGCSRPPSPPAHLVLITLDTVRADRLGAYGRGGAGTTWLDGLAARGTRFERAYTPVPLTLPAHLSILTGRYPPAVGVHLNGEDGGSTEIPTAAEILSRAGFFTAAAIGGYPLGGRSPARRGFQAYDDGLRVGPSGEALERSAEEVVTAALRSLRDRGTRRVFLWVHLFDAHDPYEPPPPFRQRFPDDPYQGEIAYVDHALARLARDLEAMVGPGRVLFTVLADHGESLGEHGEATHGYFLYEATVRVPFLLAGPGVAAGSVVRGPVSTVDWLPTVLQLLGVAHSGRLDGRSLQTDPAPRAPLYLETLLPQASYGFAPLHGAVDGALKYVAAPRPEIYDLRTDPGELHNVWPERPEDAQRLARWVGGIAGPASDRVPPPTDPRLASLGYVGAGATGAAAGTDPKDGLPVYRDFQDAARALEAGRPDAALPLLDRLLARADTPSVHLKRAQALRMAGRLEDARQACALAAREPALPGVHLEAARIAAALEDWPATLREADSHLAGDPTSTIGHLLRGAGLEMLGQPGEAERAYRLALAVDPSYRDASLRLAALLVRSGRIEEARSQLGAHLRFHADDALARGLLDAL